MATTQNLPPTVRYMVVGGASTTRQPHGTWPGSCARGAWAAAGTEIGYPSTLVEGAHACGTYLRRAVSHRRKGTTVRIPYSAAPIHMSARNPEKETPKGSALEISR